MLAAISISVALALGLPAVTAGGAGVAPLSTTLSCGSGLSCPAPVAPGDAVPPASLLPKSLFNQDVTSWPVAHDSAAIVDEFNRDWRTNYGSVGVNTRPVVWVPATQPMVPLSVQAGCQDFRDETGATAPIPSWAPVSGPGDDILTVYQPSSHSVWELWQAHRVTAQSATAHAGSPGNRRRLERLLGRQGAPEHVHGRLPITLRRNRHRDIQLGHRGHRSRCAFRLYQARHRAPGCQLHDLRLPGQPGTATTTRGPRPKASGSALPPASIAPTTTPPRSRTRCASPANRGASSSSTTEDSDGIEADFASGTWTDEGNPGPAGTWQRTASGACAASSPAEALPWNGR